MQRLLLGFCLICLTACGHYHVGSGGYGTGVKLRHLYVAPAKNHSAAPQAQAVLTQNVIDVLKGAGELILVADKDDADIELLVTITEFTRPIAATTSHDVDVATTFLLHMSAECDLKDLSTGKYLLEHKSVGVSMSERANAVLQVAEYQALPELTRKLALKIRDMVVEIWESRHDAQT